MLIESNNVKLVQYLTPPTTVTVLLSVINHYASVNTQKIGHRAYLSRKGGNDFYNLKHEFSSCYHRTTSASLTMMIIPRVDRLSYE